MRVELSGDILRAVKEGDCIVPVRVHRWFRKPRETRLFVEGPNEKTNVIAEDGGFVNTELRTWAIGQVNKGIMARRLERQQWEE